MPHSELERDVGLAGARHRAHLAHVADDADRFLDGPRDEVLDLERRGARQLGADRERRVGEVGQQVDLQAQQRHDAEQQQRDRQHEDRDAPTDRELDDVHGSSRRVRPSDATQPRFEPRSTTAARGDSSISRIALPDLRPFWPTTTMRSSPCRPSTTSIEAAVREARCGCCAVRPCRRSRRTRSARPRPRGSRRAGCAARALRRSSTMPTRANMPGFSAARRVEHFDRAP